MIRIRSSTSRLETSPAHAKRSWPTSTCFSPSFSWFASHCAPKLALALDLNSVTNELIVDEPSTSLKGLAADARYQLTSAAGLGVRYERLDDEGLFGGIDQVLQEGTLTAEYKFADGFLARAEFRRDWTDERFFPGRLGRTDLRHGQNTALVGGVWWFGNRHGTW